MVCAFPLVSFRGLCDCTPVHNFVVIAQKRSGTYFFRNALLSHSQVMMADEILNWIYGSNTNFSLARSIMNRLYNMQTLSKDEPEIYGASSQRRYYVVERKCVRAVGFKWQIDQFVSLLTFCTTISKMFCRVLPSLLLLGM